MNLIHGYFVQSLNAGFGDYDNLGRYVHWSAGTDLSSLVQEMTILVLIQVCCKDFIKK